MTSLGGYVSPVHKSAILNDESVVLRTGTEQEKFFFSGAKLLTAILQDTKVY